MKQSVRKYFWLVAGVFITLIALVMTGVITPPRPLFRNDYVAGAERPPIWQGNAIAGPEGRVARTDHRENMILLVLGNYSGLSQSSPEQFRFVIGDSWITVPRSRNMLTVAKPNTAMMQFELREGAAVQIDQRHPHGYGGQELVAEIREFVVEHERDRFDSFLAGGQTLVPASSPTPAAP